MVEKTIGILFGIVLTSLVAACPAPAGEDARIEAVFPLAEEIITPENDQIMTGQGVEAGWHVNMLIGGGVVSGRTSGLGYDAKNKKLYNLDEKANTRSEWVPFIMGSLGYTFATGTMIRTDLEALVQGFTFHIDQSLGNLGFASLALGTSRYDVWKNPYLIDIDRERTQLTESWITIGHSIAGLSVSGSATSQKIKDDEIGSRIKELKRDGHICEVAVSYAIPTRDMGVIIPTLSYQRQAFGGKANSSHGYYAEIEHSFGIGQLLFSTGLSYGNIKYDSRHPVFGAKRKETVHGISETIAYHGFFGNPRLYTFLMLAWESTKADYDFFEDKDFISVLGIGFAF